MGVTGSGKTTVGERLAADLGWRFHDADDFHSPANKAKMHAGLPLTDEDRWPWLDAIHAALERDVAGHVSAVVACSALREVYRQRLEAGLPDVGLVLLDGDPAILASRLSHRHRSLHEPGPPAESDRHAGASVPRSRSSTSRNLSACRSP